MEKQLDKTLCFTLRQQKNSFKPDLKTKEKYNSKIKKCSAYKYKKHVMKNSL